jgi:hypothetical protein
MLHIINHNGAVLADSELITAPIQFSTFSLNDRSESILSNSFVLSGWTMLDVKF